MFSNKKLISALAMLLMPDVTLIETFLRTMKTEISDPSWQEWHMYLI